MDLKCHGCKKELKSQLMYSIKGLPGHWCFVCAEVKLTTGKVKEDDISLAALPTSHVDSQLACILGYSAPTMPRKIDELRHTILETQDLLGIPLGFDPAPHELHSQRSELTTRLEIRRRKREELNDLLDSRKDRDSLYT